MLDRVRVGAAQVAPHFFDKRKTLEKTVRVTEIIAFEIQCDFVPVATLGENVVLFVNGDGF